ncbi:MAG: glutamate--cysteine ligase, partial [Rhizobacter sp.]|nr:glutamate--cysteine ligase [Rhizobacter sp.]
LHMPHGTSLRMGRLGYQSEAQASLSVSYNSLESYAASLHDALIRPYAPYKKIGIRNLGGDYNQLATTLLQIENEFYGTIRPKRVIFPGERPLHALRDRGVEYVEVRCMDLDPFVPVGIREQTTRFLDVFLLHCLLSDSPRDTPAEIKALGRNQERTAARGRESGLLLERAGALVPLNVWGRELVGECAPIAEVLDALHGGTDYRDAVQTAAAGLDEPDGLPSAQVLQAMRGDFDGSYVRFMRDRSEQTRRTLMALPYGEDIETEYRRLAAESIAKQQAIEATDSLPFEAFRQQYLSPDRLKVRRPEPQLAAAAQR